MDPQLRPAEATDFNFFYELYMHPDVNPYLLYEWMGEEEFRPVWQELMDKQVLYVLEAGSEPVGMCKLVPQYHRNSHMVYLGGVAIHPDHGGKGYGKSLMEAIIQKAKANGIKRIELSTAVDNERAIRLYERSGFQIEGRLRNYTWLKSEERFIDEYLMSWLEG
ncbi:GNAT family N-acetyltransferase [Flavihumibacter rivuli]|uniref:GNAT family N-acetyltransferase n=1 Tax=Flavihumibacter rivuli TaxID=2838156 RepID=UPI001BDED582|nr:GNAT family N-acetyltransferase [Flavihumibacter rivuli]ULQ55785.1 GNAT family N-acetyltransferase [Flavihumibacter rivuli]